MTVQSRRFGLEGIILVLTLIWAGCTALPEASTEMVPMTANRIDRGKYIVEGIGACGFCHTSTLHGIPVVEEHLAGGNIYDEPGLGTIPVPNITSEMETGVGGWTDGELIRAIREGVDNKGLVLFPVMPYSAYKDMSDNDVRAVVAYLRTLPQVANEIPARKLAFPLNMVFSLFTPKRVPVSNVPDPPPGDPIVLGKYLVALGRCSECHTPFKSGGFEPDMSKYMAGGRPYSGPWGTTYSANLTPDKETGLGEHADDEIIMLLRTGRHESEELRPPMSLLVPHLKQVTSEDLDAIVAYLRSIPPIENVVPEFVPLAAEEE